MRDGTILSKLLVLLVAIGSSLSLVTEIPFVQGSTDEGGGDEGNEGDSTEEDGGGSDEEGGATTPVTPREPSAEEEANDNDNNEDSSDEPLPYCDTGASPCHDIDDVDEETGKFPCNDGTQRANKADCPDATKPTLPNSSPSFNIVDFGSFSVQGSSGPSEQTGPIPIPKLGEAVLKIIYDDEWSGNILDSNMTSISYDGDGNYSIVFPCEENDGIYSLTIQKGDDDNEVLQLVVQNSKNQTLDSGQTTAEFGIVSLSGECKM